MIPLGAAKQIRPVSTIDAEAETKAKPQCRREGGGGVVVADGRFQVILDGLTLNVGDCASERRPA